MTQNFSLHLLGTGLLFAADNFQAEEDDLLGVSKKILYQSWLDCFRAVLPILAQLNLLFLILTKKIKWGNTSAGMENWERWLGEQNTFRGASMLPLTADAGRCILGELSPHSRVRRELLQKAPAFYSMLGA
ncbi:hypothetical protein [Microcoleus sp. FACHB-68]|uniref:hypothetical protein n=1 Tax=Microcoleus sp. FACHB-68 TaxID=2692826 RepID=UPI001684D0BC|nr:hypothetical protein [Microcoleus sp. FACHB-68]MBD1938613.1 hypothetical protein [Microcoleus sp. FACHB-68]